MADGRSLLTGLFVGGLIGGAAVLLSAPSSGKELRGKIKAEVIKDVGGELQTSIKRWQEEIKPHQQDLQKEIADIEEKIRQLEKTLQN